MTAISDSPAPMPLTGFLPEDPIHPQGPEFFAQVQEILHGQPKPDEAVEAALTGWDSLLEKIAGDLYRIASMLIGEGEETIGIIEQAVATADIPACANPEEARHSGRVALAVAAIGLLTARDAGILGAPAADSGPVSCIDEDDLSAAGVTSAELEVLLNGPDRGRLRAWLEGLGNPMRLIFVLRAVAGLSTPEVAGLLSLHGGASAKGWTPESVRAIFRAALCSLASQMIQASNAR